MEVLDAKAWEKKLLQGYQEQSYFLNYIKEECGDNEEEILQSLKGNKQEEDKIGLLEWQNNLLLI